MTTENCFEHMSHLSKCLTGKNSTDGSPYGSFHHPFFRCNITPKSALFSVSAKTARNVLLHGIAYFNDNGKGIFT
jgi:hypothetical protein